VRPIYRRSPSIILRDVRGELSEPSAEHSPGHSALAHAAVRAVTVTSVTDMMASAEAMRAAMSGRNICALAKLVTDCFHSRYKAGTQHHYPGHRPLSSVTLQLHFQCHKRHNCAWVKAAFWAFRRITPGPGGPSRRECTRPSASPAITVLTIGRYCAGASLGTRPLNGNISRGDHIGFVIFSRSRRTFVSHGQSGN
jgi:hypothetical protein